MVGVITEWGGTMDKQLASFQLSCSIVILYYNHYVRPLVDSETTMAFARYLIRSIRNVLSQGPEPRLLPRRRGAIMNASVSADG
jgi:hypothetical protein